MHNSLQKGVVQMEAGPDACQKLGACRQGLEEHATNPEGCVDTGKKELKKIHSSSLFFKVSHDFGVFLH
jgi:hypothetical protein